MYDPKRSVLITHSIIFTFADSSRFPHCRRYHKERITGQVLLPRLLDGLYKLLHIMVTLDRQISFLLCPFNRVVCFA